MSALQLALGAALLVIAALHAYWAFGGIWPAADAAGLVRTVVGDPRFKRMPGRTLSLAVAAMLAIAGALALAPPVGMLAIADLGAALVFLGRGVAGYVPAWRRGHTLEPFARLDRLIYSPLCLALGAGFAGLAASGLGILPQGAGSA